LACRSYCVEKKGFLGPTNDGARILGSTK